MLLESSVLFSLCCGQLALGGKWGLCTRNGILVREFSPVSGTEDSLLLRVAGLRVITGYVCSFFVFLSAAGFGVGAWRVFGGSRSLSHPARGPVAPQALRLEREVWWLPLTGLSWLPYALGSGARGPTIFPGTFPKLIYC